VKRVYSAEAQDGKVMTLGELRRFVQAPDVSSVGDGAELKVRVSFGGGIKSITITDTNPPTDTPPPGTNPWN
jgi:hypothetical protein